MKIAIINGKEQKGSSHCIAQSLVSMLGECDVSEFFLSTDLSGFCTGCGLCLSEPKKCPHYLQKERIMSCIKEADLLIFTSPVYCMLPSAQLKSFFDLFFSCWLSHRPKPAMFRKRAVVITTATATGAGRVAKQIKYCLSYWGIPKVYCLGVNMFAKTLDKASDKKKKRIHKKVRRLAKRIKTENRIHVPTKTKILFSFFNYLHKKNIFSSDGERTYRREMGWFDGKKPF